MNIKKTLLSSVFCGGLLLSSGAQAAMPMAKQAILKPSSGWAISKIEAKALGGGSYCALARKFESDIILTIARNGNDESSIALDFQVPSLAKGRSYDVELEPGYGQTRKFAVNAVSEKALVFKVGKDYAFFDALNRSTILRIKASGKDLTFDLTHYFKGQQKLNGCLVTLTEPAAGDEGISEAGAPVPAVKAEKAPVTPLPSAPESMTAELDSEIRNLRDENDRLKSALRTQRQNYEERMMDRPDSSIVNDLSERMLVLKKENSILRQQLNQNKVQDVAEAKPAAAVCEIDTKQDEMAALKRQLIDLRAENAVLVKEIEGLNGKIASLNERLKVADSRVASADEKARLAEEKLVEAGRRAVALEADLRLANAKAEKAFARLSGLEGAQGDQLAAQTQEFAAQKQEYEERVKGLLSQISILEEQNRDLRLEASAAKASVVAAADQAPLLPVVSNDDALISKIRMLESDLDRVKLERDQYARQIESLDAVTDSAGAGAINISTSNWDLEKATRRFNEAEREIRRLGARLEEERRRCMTEKKDIEHMLFDPAIATQQQVSKLQQLENELVKKDAAYSTLEARYEQDIKALKRDIALGEQEINVLEASLKETQGRGHIRKAASSVSQEDQAELANLRARNSEMSQQIALLQGQIRTIRNRDSMELQMVEPAAGDNYRGVIAEPPGDFQAFEQQEIAWNRQVIDKNTRDVESAYVTASVAPAPASTSLEPIDLIEGNKAYDLPPVSIAVEKGGANDFVNVGELTSLLERSGFSLKTPVKYEQNQGDGEGVAYSWSSGNLYGTAEQKHIAGLDDFDAKVGAYLQKTESRCRGEFAAVPDIALDQDGVYISTYDIACVSESGGSAAASLMFVGQQNILTSFAFEANIDAMGSSIEARNKMINLIDKEGFTSL